jgi:hypothetical protein
VQPTAAQQTAAQPIAAQQTAAQMEESVATTLKIASDWKAKGDVRWELSCVGQVLEGLLTIAVTHHDSFEAGVAYLHGKHAEELLARYHELNTALLNAFLANPKGARAAVDHQVSFAHIGWLLGRYALGDAILQIASNTEIAKYWPLTKFWTEYHRAMTCLVRREAYIPRPPPRLRGYEKHWEPYLRVVEALTSGADLAPALGVCADSFTRRNRDKRLNSFPFDGNGRDPVRWEFRLPSILARWNAGG